MRAGMAHRALIAAALLAAGAARGAAWELDLDLRAVSSDASTSVLDNGYGPTRFSEGQSGLQLGRVRLALDTALGEVWRLHLDASAWGNGNYENPIGLTEAYLQFRPYPRDALRLRVKAGAFYAPISLENQAAGWSSPYTLSYSALNSWIAQELRTVGLETQLDWLGSRCGLPFDVDFVGGTFGWNEGAGSALAARGFIQEDRQTPVFDSVGGLRNEAGARMEPFRQIDGRFGYYGGVELRYLDRLVVRALRYDNRADPSARDTVSGVLAWRTSFNSAGARAQLGAGWTAVAQWAAGRTAIAPGRGALEWPFNARYALVSKQLGRHTLSVRYDRFEVDSRNAEPDGAQSGHSWTAAYGFSAARRWTVTLEWLRVTSSSYSGGEYLDRSGPSTDTEAQLALRYSFGALPY
jgi:hypothetical protein